LPPIGQPIQQSYHPVIEQDSADGVPVFPQTLRLEVKQNKHWNGLGDIITPSQGPDFLWASHRIQHGDQEVPEKLDQQTGAIGPLHHEPKPVGGIRLPVCECREAGSPE
jgi:hypothetical protein